MNRYELTSFVDGARIPRASGDEPDAPQWRAAQRCLTSCWRAWSKSRWPNTPLGRRIGRTGYRLLLRTPRETLAVDGLTQRRRWIPVTLQRLADRPCATDATLHRRRCYMDLKRNTLVLSVMLRYIGPLI